MKNENEKSRFLEELKKLADSLAEKISSNDEWTVRGIY